MICVPCRVAGGYTSATQDPAINLPRDYLLTVATEWHAECLGGTQCDCQHRLEGVNQELLKRQKQEAGK